MERQEALKKLSGRIKVTVTEDAYGCVIIKPVNERDRELIAATNEYNHSYSLFLQFYDDIYSFLVNYPQSRFRVPSNQYSEGYKIGRYTYEVNSGVKFYIDSWDFRHMVGGQSD